MGKMKQQLIEEMSIGEVKELLNNFNPDHSNGYIQFLEQQLEKAEQVIDRIKELADDEVIVSIQDSMAGPYIEMYYERKG